MSTTTKIYNVNKIKQLIEINGDMTNFSADFSIESKDYVPFKALIISDTELNSGNPITYQEVSDGKIEGNVTNDKGVYDSYFILLKSDEPTECQVSIVLKEVPINPEIIKYQEELQKQEELRIIEEENLRRREEENMIRREEETKSKIKVNLKENFVSNPKKSKNWIFIFIGFSALIGIGIWLFFKNKKKLKIDSGKIEITGQEPIVIETKIPEVIIPKLELETKLPEVIIPNLETIVEAPKLETIIPKKSDLVNRINSYFGKE